ncbi:hypothetical protein D3C87_1257260 [compost metagenome]|jgi:hypothetical protein
MQRQRGTTSFIDTSRGFGHPQRSNLLRGIPPGHQALLTLLAANPVKTGLSSLEAPNLMLPLPLHGPLEGAARAEEDYKYPGDL